jgi:hypothetical protein
MKKAVFGILSIMITGCMHVYSDYGINCDIMGNVCDEAGLPLPSVHFAFVDKRNDYIEYIGKTDDGGNFRLTVQYRWGEKTNFIPGRQKANNKRFALLLFAEGFESTTVFFDPHSESEANEVSIGEVIFIRK